MNLIASVIPWIQANWDTILQVYLQIIGLASIIVKLTPTLKDDDVLKGVIRFLGKYLALNKSVGPNV
jgi:hypothetical protein